MTTNRKPKAEWNIYNIVDGPRSVLTVSGFSVFEVSGERDNVNKIKAILYDIKDRKPPTKNHAKYEAFLEKRKKELTVALNVMTESLATKPDCDAKSEAEVWVDAVRKLTDDLRYISQKEYDSQTKAVKDVPRKEIPDMLKSTDWKRAMSSRQYMMFAQAILMRNDVQALMKGEKYTGPRLSAIHKPPKRSLKFAIDILKKNQADIKRAEQRLARMPSGTERREKRKAVLAGKINATKDYMKDTMKSFPPGFKHGLDQKIGQTQAASHTAAPPLPPLPPLNASVPPAPPPPAAKGATPSAPPPPPPRPEPAKMPGKLAVPASTLKTIPRPQSEQKNQRTPSLLTSDLLDKMLAKLADNGWTRTSPPFENNKAEPVVVGKGKESFTIGLDKMTTNSNSEETFSAMLQAHISAHGDDVSKMPRITTNPNDAKKWEKLVKAAYKVDKVPEGVIEMKQAPAPVASKPTENQPADPQQDTAPVSPRRM